MKIQIKTAVISLAVLAPTAFAMQQRPKPEPAPAPPTQGETQREDAKQQQRIQKARQAEHEKQKERIKLAREAEKEAAKAEKRADNPNAERPAREDARETARKMFEVEALHRDHVGRMDRLLTIFRESNDLEKIQEVETLKAKEHKRYLLIIDQFRSRLGDSYAQYESHLLAGQQRGSRAPAFPRERESEPRREGQTPKKPSNQGGGK